MVVIYIYLYIYYNPKMKVDTFIAIIFKRSENTLDLNIGNEDDKDNDMIW